MDETPKITKGVDVIAAFLKTLPQMPGVYRMLNASGDALYVGKARDLKKRVTAYTRPDKLPVRLQRMIADTSTMEFITTHTEAEALLLEANIIKKLKPRYNILLRDDKSFPYIMISAGHDYPQVVKHRGGKEQKGEYYGPFASGFAVNETLNVLHRGFLLRNCSDNIFALRTRPCLQYQIKRCTAPCVGKVTKEQYAQQVDMARQFLQGKSRAIQDAFAREMERASEAMDYETAAQYRDRIRALTQIQAHQMVHIEGIESADVHVLYQDKGFSCVQVFFFRAGQNYGNRAYFPRHQKDEEPASILAAFVAQFYTTRPVPREIIVNHDLADRDVLEDALKIRAGNKVSIVNPARGTKKEMVAMAYKNAREALARRMAVEAKQEMLFERLVEVFNLPGTPERVEVYDNSHTGGTHALGAMIVATPEGFNKNAYRKFNVKEAYTPGAKAPENTPGRYTPGAKAPENIPGRYTPGAKAPENIPGRYTPGDDYAMMREMLTRRFHALLKSDEEGEYSQWPDLILIDGGQGQLNAALQVMAELGISDVPVAAIAKGPDRNAGRETFFMEGRTPFSLESGDPVLYFLQNLRDEAHRFAITSHRARRAKAISATPLDDIPGIGSRRKKALLMHFGSAKAVAESGIADLQKVEGISRTVAEKIYSFFHETE